MISTFFENLSPESMLVVIRASEEARRLGHSSFGAEHLLAALLRNEKSLASIVLKKSGLTLRALRQELRNRQKGGLGVLKIEIEPKSCAVRVIEIAQSQAADTETIRPEHILAGLIQEAESTDNVVAEILKHVGITTACLREQLATS